MKKIVIALLMIFSFFSMSSCRPGYQEDIMLQWFDVTEYKQELWDMCYGDGYVNYVPGDPYWCPIYSDEEIDVKLSNYMGGFNYTYVENLGLTKYDDALTELQTSYRNLFTNQDAIDRLSGVFFYTVVAKDEEENEVIVYLPEYVPIDSDVKMIKCDFPNPLNYGMLDRVIHEHLDECTTFSTTIEVITVDGSEERTYNYQVCIDEEMLYELSYVSSSYDFTSEGHFVSILDTYIMEEDEYEPSISPYPTYITYEDDQIKFYCYMGRDEHNMVIYSPVFTFDMTETTQE